MKPVEKNDLQCLVLEWQRPVYNLAYRMLGHEADAADATQEIFARIFVRYHRLRDVQSIKPWIFRVAMNVVLNPGAHDEALHRVHDGGSGGPQTIP